MHRPFASFKRLRLAKSAVQANGLLKDYMYIETVGHMMNKRCNMCLSVRAFAS